MNSRFFDKDYLEFMNEAFSADNYRDLSARILKVTALKINADIATLWRAKKDKHGQMQLTLGGTYKVEFLPIEKKITYAIPKQGARDEQIAGLTAWIGVRKIPVKIDKPEELTDTQKPWSKSYKGKWDKTVFWEKDKFGCLIGFPLTKGNDLLGVIKFERFENEEPFSNEDYNKILFFIPLIVEALNGMSLREEQEKKRQKYLHELTSALQVPSSKTYYEDIVKMIATILSADNCTLWLVKNQHLALTAHFGLTPETLINQNEKRYTLPNSNTVSDDKIEGLTVWALIRNQPFYANNWEKLKEHPSHRGRWDPDMWDGKPEKKFGCLYMVPLAVGKDPIGVLKVERKNISNFVPFNETERSTFDQIALMVAMAPRLRGDINKLENSLQRLIKIGSLKAQQKLFDKIVDEASTLIGTNNCELYTLTHYGEHIVLRAETQRKKFNVQNRLEPISYNKGECLVGWIFETSKPLCIKDVRKFKDEYTLSDKELELLSDNNQINHEDNRQIQWKLNKERDSHSVLNQNYSFLGVPIKSEFGDVQGVLRMSDPKTKLCFSKDDMQLLTNFAEIIAQAIYNNRQSRLNKVLVDIGNLSKKKALFDYVVNQMPGLVMGRGCSIFLKDMKSPFKEKYCLKYTNSDFLKKSNHVRDFYYTPDNSKTGFVCKVGKTLVINYYGYGKLQKKLMQRRFSEFLATPQYLVDYLYDENRKAVGIIRLVLGKELNEKSEDENINKERKIKRNNLELQFSEFCKANIYKDRGLPSIHLCETGSDKKTKSFLAVPIIAKEESVLGVLRIPRTTNSARFSQNAIELVESITERLASVLQIERKADEIKENLKILYDINSKINSSFTKDSILDAILYTVTEKLGYEFACIQLADHKKGIIKTVKGRHNKNIENAVDPNSPGWLGYEHPLVAKNGEKTDIQVHVLMELGDVLVVKGWHHRFNKDIYEKCNHKELVRAWVPIIAHDPRQPEPLKIGTLEAGHNIKRKDNINSQELEVLKAVANQLAIIILNWEQREKLLKSKDKVVVNQISFITRLIGHKMSNTVGNIKFKSDQYIERLAQKDFEIKRHKLKADFEEFLDCSTEALSLPPYLRTLVEKYQDLSIKNIDFERLWRSVIKRILKKMESESKVKIEQHNDIPLKCDVFCDQELLYWTIEELVQNAIRALPIGGTIQIDAVQKKNKFIIISVKDNGIGIAPENIDKIFDVGFSTRDDHRERETPGTGLWLIRTVIQELFEGKIVAESFGEGSCFIIYLPCVISFQRERELNKMEFRDG